MTAPNGTGNGTGRHADFAGSRPVVLLRPRRHPTDAGPRLVHLAPLPEGALSSALTALCGTLLHPDAVEQVTAGEGTPCSPCLVSHIATLPGEPLAAAAEALDPGPAAAASTYREWGWPVLLRRDQVWLALGAEAVALTVPTAAAARAAALLTVRRCPPAMFAHPYAPEHQVLLAGEPYGVALPWPPGVHQVATSVLLPPTMTPRGPLTWTRAPLPDALTLCREIDVLAALRAAADEPPPSTPTAF
ncbi:MAG: hypothetical protein ACRDSP_04370 [Pseudonocardiaceae bacterium]